MPNRLDLWRKALGDKGIASLAQLGFAAGTPGTRPRCGHGPVRLPSFARSFQALTLHAIKNRPMNWLTLSAPCWRPDPCVGCRFTSVPAVSRSCRLARSTRNSKSCRAKLSLKEGQASRHANVLDGLPVQQAMTRRAAAAEIAGIATFDLAEVAHVPPQHSYATAPARFHTGCFGAAHSCGQGAVDGRIPQGGCLLLAG